MVIKNFKGLKCPLPILKARRCLEEMEAGEQIEFQTTDPGAPADFKAFCEMAGHKVIALKEDQNGDASIIIEKGAE